MEIAYPFHIDRHGHTGAADDDEHIRQMLEQLLFTMPGERVNRPGFGAGLMQLVFAPGSDELATAAQFMIQGTLQQWLGDVVQVEAVEVTAEEASVRVTVQYVVRRTQQRRLAQFER